MIRRVRGFALAGLAALAGACGADTPPVEVVDLQRPSDVAFGCFGDMRLTMGAPPSADQAIVASAMPVSSCADWFGGTPPAGQEELDGSGPQPPSFVNFILEPAKGTLAVVAYEASGAGLAAAGVIDTDPLIPGLNPVPVGTLPVALMATVDACQVVTANSGSCDLSVVEVASVIAFEATPRVDRLQITTPGGVHVLAKPADLVGGPASGEVGFTCPDTAQGVAWIAYPDCHAAAAVDLTSGMVRASVRFAADGTASIGDGEIDCMDECGDGAVIARHDGTTPRPIALHVAADGQRLYIGTQNHPALTIVDIDAELLPTAVQQVAVEGEVGLRRVIETGVVAMGGATGFLGDGTAGDMTFAYAIATDNTIRVIEVGARMVECDTQVDPRYLHDVTDTTFLSCMPVGDLATPPRRSGALSPGIHIPRITGSTVVDYEGIPLDLALTIRERPEDVEPDPLGDAKSKPCTALIATDLTGPLAPSPVCMVGTFVFASTADGQVYVINVDDDVYPDVEDPLDPILVTMPLAIAHQLRDTVSNRDDVDGFRVSDPSDQTLTGEVEVNCTGGVSAAIYGTRLAAAPELVFDVTTATHAGHVAVEKRFMLPRIRGSHVCTPDDGSADVLVHELDWAAPPADREAAFPDVHATRNEAWRLTWEGPISRDGSDQAIDGPSTRVGSARAGAVSFRIDDAAAPFCRAGLQPFDIGVLAGCDPARGDSQCGAGETCFVHPDAPSALPSNASGMCLPAGAVDEISDLCRGLLVSRRHYTVTETSATFIALKERRRALEATPPEGCTDAAHCDQLWERQRALAEPDHPNAESLEPPAGDYTWACEADPTRAPATNRCLMTCATETDCEEGFVCSTTPDNAGYCVEGPLPPRKCIEGLQRYQLRVGDAFALIGSSTGFLHNRIPDATGACIDDPAGSPLRVGRVPLDPPACTGAGPTDLSPNPCSTTVETTDAVDQYELNNDGICTLTSSIFRTRTVPAIRVENPALRVHLTEPVTTGDAVCLGDGAGTGPRYSTVHQGLQIALPLTGGLLPQFVFWQSASDRAAARYPAVLAPAPDGGIWVLDQGDRSAAIQGQILRFDPGLPMGGFVVVVIVGRE